MLVIVVKKFSLKKIPKKSILILFLCVFIGGLFLIRLSFSFELKGKNKITIPYQTEYKEEGVQLHFLHLDLSKKVSVQGKVNSEKLGTYKLTYSYKLGFIPVKREREVEVVDETDPVITLDGNMEQQICPNATYQEEGYHATDNYDGDITDQVEVIDEGDSIKYKVADSSGNSAVLSRSILKKDDASPTIRLSSGSVVYVKQGNAYKEYGYTAVDGCDGDLTSKVVVEGSVDTSKLGTYQLTYKVTDSSNNTATITRKVVVNENKTSTSSGKPGVIYLTFDDGPQSGSTEKILNVLKQEGVKATFFVTGNGPDSLLKREFDEGHTIALHTNTHRYEKVYSGVDAYFDDLKKVEDRVIRITGTSSKVIRFPGGSNNTISNKYSSGIMSTLRNQVEAREYVYFDWNVDGNDAGTCAKSSVKDKKTCVYNNVTKNLSKNRSNVVLMHDVKSYTAEAIADIIHYGKQNGYNFEVLTKDVAPVHFK